MLATSFVLYDIVWCRDRNNDFWMPGKIVAEEGSDNWQIDNLFFVEAFSDGLGERPKGVWSKTSELVRFDNRKDYVIKFQSPSIAKAYDLARQEFLSGNNRIPVLKLKRYKEEWQILAATRNHGTESESFKPKSNLLLTKGQKPITRLAPIMEEVSEYEKLQEKRREEQKQMLLAMKLASFEVKRTSTPHANKRGASGKRSALRQQQITPVRYSTRKQPPRSYSQTNLEKTFGVNESRASKRPVFEENCVASKTRKQSHPTRSIKKPNNGFLTADQISTQMLENVIEISRTKIYDTVKGTTCHQCRQKTLDMKTICRSGRCRGLQGQYCGVCLRNRYGEDAREALKNPNWTCPLW